MNSKQYWIDRENQKLNKGIKDCNNLAKELEHHYKLANKEIEKEINNLFEKYAKDNQLTYAEATKYLTGNEFKIWRTDIKGYLKMIEDNPELLLELNTLAMKSRITRLEALQYEIDKQLNKLAITTEKETKELLTDTLKDNYNRNVFNISKKAGFVANFSGINNKTLERVLSYEWSGNNYSGRIWNNKQQLSKTIKEEITQMLIRGESSKKVSQRVATRMNASYKNAVRLVQTEHSYVMEQANKITYEDLKVEKYQFLATPDERTCKVCGNLDLKIFNVKDMIPGKNCSPLHPSCRCTSLLYYEDEDDENSTRFARDKNGKRIEIPSNMTFNEWKKKYID